MVAAHLAHAHTGPVATRPRSDRPLDVEYVRTVSFDQSTVPAGLLRAHKLSANTWGELGVESGSLDFMFEDAPNAPHSVHAGHHVEIPPELPHRVVLTGKVSFSIKFFKGSRPAPSSSEKTSDDL